MPQWRGSDRRSRLPANWPTIRRRIFRRDGGRCTYRDYDGRRCNAPATDVDHIIPGDDHSDANLRSLCSAHHRTKSSSEGGTALAAIKRRNDQKFRRTEEHPGLL